MINACLILTPFASHGSKVSNLKHASRVTTHEALVSVLSLPVGHPKACAPTKSGVIWRPRGPKEPAGGRRQSVVQALAQVQARVDITE